MKKAISYFVLFLFAMTLMTGCSYVFSTVPGPSPGFLYTDVKGPVTATNLANSPKSGTSESSSILGLIATGDSSIEAAAKNGGITKIHHVDYHYTNFLGLYSKFAVTVYGE